MANKKFSEFVLKTSTSDVSHIVGYNGSENVQITPANFVTTGGTGVFLPLAGGLMVGNTTHNDNVKSIYGTGSDLEIYHDGSNSFIKDVGTGNLKLRATNLNLQNSGGSNYINCISGGASEIYFNNSKKFETTNTGISVTGDVGVDVIPEGKLGVKSATGEVGFNAGTSISPERGNMYFTSDGSGWKFNIGKYQSSTFSPLMTFQDNGNVGVGTSSPSTKFVVAEGTGQHGLELIPGATGFLQAYDRATNTYGDLRVDTLNTIFATNNGSERMRITSAGNVGVGTSSPSTKFVVADSTNGDGIELVPGSTSIIQAFDRTASLYSNLNIDTLETRVRSIGATVFNNGSGFSESMRITSGGDLLINTASTPDGTSNYGSGFIKGNVGRSTLYMATSTTSAASLQVFFNPNGVIGSISVTGSATSYNTSSDYRLKEDLQDFKGLELVSKIPVYDYKWKADKSRSYGVMAHELEEVLPQAVSGKKDAEEMQSVDYSKIVPLLVKSIQELSAKLEALKCQCEKK